MPLHLLGKKSWNVYNSDNVARVRRDEAAAQEREAEEERRMQEVDAERRIQILRGMRPKTPPSPAVEEQHAKSEQSRGEHTNTQSERPAKRRRKLAGEDDTDRDIRFAREDAASTVEATGRREVLSKPTKSSSNAPILDRDGHVDLFPVNERGSSRKHIEKNKEAEAEAAKKKREYEDQYTMRFSNAAGFKQGIEKPWYSRTASAANGDVEADGVDRSVGKDVWGNEDPRRRDREKARIEATDPLASMKTGVKRLKQVEEEKRGWDKDRARELEDLRRAQRKQHGRTRSAEDDGLGDFSLDGDPAIGRPPHTGTSSKHDKHRVRRRDHSRDGDRDSESRRRHRHRHRPRDRDRDHHHSGSRHRSHSETIRRDRRYH